MQSVLDMPKLRFLYTEYFPNLSLKGGLCSGFCQIHIPFIKRDSVTDYQIDCKFNFRGHLGLNWKDSFCHFLKKKSSFSTIFELASYTFSCKHPQNCCYSSDMSNFDPHIMHQLILLSCFISVVAD